MFEGTVSLDAPICYSNIAFCRISLHAKCYLFWQFSIISDAADLSVLWFCFCLLLVVALYQFARMQEIIRDLIVPLYIRHYLRHSYVWAHNVDPDQTPMFLTWKKIVGSNHRVDRKFRNFKFVFKSCGKIIFKPCIFLRRILADNKVKFTTKKWKFSDKKFLYFSYFCSKYRLWVLIRTASTRRF